MNQSPEQLDNLIHRLKHSDLSSLPKDPESSGSINLVSLLTNISKSQIPQPNLLRVKNKILDRISIPAQLNSNTASSGFRAFIPRFIRITSGIVGAFTIMLGLTIGTAVAALESIPGQTIYPLKKIVEQVQLQLANSEEQRANLEIKFANTRIDELETVLQKQKEGKISSAEVQKVVVNTVKDLEKTTQTVANQSKEQPKVNLLTKIVTLSDKQTAVITAANLVTEGQVKIELEKALEASKTAKELAIDNIERAGMVVESDPVLVTEAPKNDNIVSAEGKVTAVTSSTVSIGTVQFLLTVDTKYVNIKSVDLKVDTVVKISGETRDKKTYATQIELVSKPEPVAPETTAPTNSQTTPTPTPTPAPSPTPTQP